MQSNKYNIEGFRGTPKKCPVCERFFRARVYSKLCSRACRNKMYAKPYTEEKRIKIKNACLGINKGEKNAAYGKFGKDSWSYGTKRTEEVKKKLSEIKIGKYQLDKNPNWKGGRSFEPYPLTWTNNLKTKIRKRDNFTCQVCNKNGYDVHHIDYNKSNLLEDNLITLCRSCHTKTNYNRNYWEETFKNKLKKEIAA